MSERVKERNRKILLAGVSTVLIGVMTMAGTFAYLQESSEEVVNTFQPNSVHVKLTETNAEEEEVTERNDFQIIPGTSEKKDPKVTVTATVDSYVFVTVEDEAAVTKDGKPLVEYEIAEGWEKLDGYDNVYYREVEAEKNKDGSQIFPVLKDDKVYYPVDLTNEDMPEAGTATLSFQAFAIQKDGFVNALAAYQMQGAVYTKEADGAKKALNAGQSVVLTDDIDFNDYEEVSASSSLYVNSKKAVTIELNGKTITGRSNSKYFNTIKATGNGTVITINGDGKVIGGSAANSSSSNNALEATNKGKIIVNGGTYTVGPDKNGNGNSVVFSNGGDIEIYGGFFYTDTSYDGKYWVLNKQDKSKGSITCYGGTFVNCNPSKTGTEPAGESDNFVAEGYKVISETKDNGDIWYTVVPEDSTDDSEGNP